MGKEFENFIILEEPARHGTLVKIYDRDLKKFIDDMSFADYLAGIFAKKNEEMEERCRQCVMKREMNAELHRDENGKPLIEKFGDAMLEIVGKSWLDREKDDTKDDTEEQTEWIKKLTDVMMKFADNCGLVEEYPGSAEDYVSTVVKSLVRLLVQKDDSIDISNDAKAQAEWIAERELEKESHCPEHYHFDGFASIDAIRQALGPEKFMGFCQGSILKYALRANRKDTFEKNMAKVIDFSTWAYDTAIRENEAENG